MLKYRIFVLWSVSPVAKLAILFSTIQLHPCPQHQSPWRTLSCFQVYFFLVRLPVAVGLDDEYPLSFLIHCRQHPSSWLQRIPGSAYIQRLSLPVGLMLSGNFHILFFFNITTSVFLISSFFWLRKIPVNLKKNRPNINIPLSSVFIYVESIISLFR